MVGKQKNAAEGAGSGQQSSYFSQNQTHQPNTTNANAQSGGAGNEEWSVHKYQGREYYYNTRTKVTQWEKPDVLKEGLSNGGFVWQTHYHEGKPYYYNTKTNKTQWEKPKELGGPDPSTLSNVPPPASTNPYANTAGPGAAMSGRGASGFLATGGHQQQPYINPARAAMMRR